VVKLPACPNQLLATGASGRNPRSAPWAPARTLQPFSTLPAFANALSSRRREWEDATKRAVGARQNTLAYLTELLTTAAEVGAEETALANNLR